MGKEENYQRNKRNFKTIKMGDEYTKVSRAVYEWLDEFRTTEKGKVTFNEILHYLIDEYRRMKKNEK